MHTLIEGSKFHDVSLFFRPSLSLCTASRLILSPHFDVYPHSCPINNIMSLCTVGGAFLPCHAMIWCEPTNIFLEHTRTQSNSYIWKCPVLFLPVIILLIQQSTLYFDHYISDHIQGNKISKEDIEKIFISDTDLSQHHLLPHMLSS